MSIKEEQLDAAIGWALRLRHASADDWEEFTGWLEADPAHGEAYNEVAMADEEAGSLPRNRPRPILPVEEHAPPRVGRRTFLGWGAAAAAALVAVTGYLSMRPQDTLYVVQTGVGERRLVELAGSRVHLAGSTRIVLDREEPRFARLETGEALFTVAHDPARPFRVEAGSTVLQDMGTIFNVVHSRGQFEVAVSEGEVLYNPKREAVSLKPGMALRQEGQRLLVRRVGVDVVGGWQKGRLSYVSAPLSQIAADLTRHTGVPVRAGEDVAAKRFSGVIMLKGETDGIFRRVSTLAGVQARRGPGGWVLTAENGESP